jgi:hypothetical protein
MAVTINGSTGIEYDDNVKHVLGTGDDLEIYHDGSYSRIVESGTGHLLIQTSELNLMNAAGSEDMIKAAADGGVELYYNNSKKVQTKSWGVEFLEDWQCLDGKKGVWGTGDDLQIYHTGGSDSYIKNTTAGSNLQITSANEVQIKVNSTENAVECNANGSVDIFYNNSKKLETTDEGIKISGSDGSGTEIVGDVFFNNGSNAGKDIKWDQSENFLRFDDSVSANFGTGSDLKIYHDGTHSYIKSNTNNFFVDICEGSKFDVHHDGETIFAGYADGRFEAMYDGSIKLQTTSNGITVTGSVSTNDLNLSNLDHTTPNEVDGTRGNWSMQEGANDLFLINRTNGKKYKFNLTEVT